MVCKVKEEFFDKEGTPYVREYLGTSENHISAIIERPVVDENEPIPEPIDKIDEVLNNQSEIIINQEYTNCLLEMQSDM